MTVEDLLIKQAMSRKQVSKYNPTPEQCRAGNYPKLHLKIQGMGVSIENPKGSYRKGVDPDGHEWSTQMKSADYGYFKRTLGADAPDQLDVFLGPKARSTKVVHVIDQVYNGKFDEHKCMMGWDTQAEAKKAYLSCYDKGWQGCGDITTMSIEAFKKWAFSADKKALSPIIKSAATAASKEFLKCLVKSAAAVQPLAPAQRPVVVPWKLDAPKVEKNPLKRIGFNWGDSNAPYRAYPNQKSLTKVPQQPRVSPVRTSPVFSPNQFKPFWNRVNTLHPGFTEEWGVNKLLGPIGEHESKTTNRLQEGYTRGDVKGPKGSGVYQIGTRDDFNPNTQGAFQTAIQRYGNIIGNQDNWFTRFMKEHPNAIAMDMPARAQGVLTAANVEQHPNTNLDKAIRTGNIWPVWRDGHHATYKDSSPVQKTKDWIRWKLNNR